jgi:SAM-dependent methyltransferase
MELPFPDASFDLVVCQFGAMFFPDRGHAFAETRRVLRDGGHFLFNVWDGVEDNELAATVLTVLATLFPDDPPRFMERIPHGYHDLATIRADLARGGFTKSPSIETITLRSRTDSARTAALAYVQGTPIRNEIESRAPARLAEVTEAAEREIAAKYGAGSIDAKTQAKVVLVAR